MIDPMAGTFFATLQARRDISGRLERFTVPRSPIHADGDRIAGQSRPASLASPSFDSAVIDAMAAKSGYVSPAVFRVPGLAPVVDESVPGNIRRRDGAEGNKSDSGNRAGGGAREPSSAQGDSAELDKLRQRDRDVRRHEQAHKAAGGRYAGAISFEYRQGSDGRRYAVGGEVGIDISKEKDPAATVAKMRQVRAAALAPADPSAQDRAVAAEAAKLEMEASREESGQSDDREGKLGDAKDAAEADSASSSGSPRESPPERSGRRGFGVVVPGFSDSSQAGLYGTLDVTA